MAELRPLLHLTGMLVRRSIACFALALLAACSGAAPTPAPAPVAAAVEAAADTTPPLQARWYLHFPSADSLAGYLRPGSGARVIVSAHRGGPAPGYPENALETLERTLQLGSAFAEVDVRLTRDSVLVLLHDDTLERTTTGTGELAALDFPAVRALLLKDGEGNVTPFRIPTLAEALAWSEGRTVLMLDVKRGVPATRIVDAIRRARAENRVVVIVYTHEDLVRYQQLAPDLLVSASFTTPDDVARAREAGVNFRRIVAFAGVGRADPEVVRQLRSLGVRVQLGTFGEIDTRAAEEGPSVYFPLVAQGITMIATDEPAVALDAARRFEAAARSLRATQRDGTPPAMAGSRTPPDP